jgi:hypothetical protein
VKWHHLVLQVNLFYHLLHLHITPLPLYTSTTQPNLATHSCQSYHQFILHNHQLHHLRLILLLTEWLVLLLTVVVSWLFYKMVYSPNILDISIDIGSNFTSRVTTNRIHANLVNDILDFWDYLIENLFSVFE